MTCTTRLGRRPNRRRKRRALAGASVARGAQPGAAYTPASGGGPPQDSLTLEEQVNVFVYQQANRSVVNINTKSVSGNAIPLFEIISEGEGSGSVIDRVGHVLTNFHVVDGAREIHVTLYDGKTYDARLVGSDPDTDVAVLKIDAPPESLFPVAFGNSANLLVGQRVFAIGNPFGLERTMSTGIISSLDRSLPSQRRPPGHQVGDPDRRLGQSGQLRRAAVGQPRPHDRHEHGHRQHDEVRARAWASPFRSTPLHG